MRKWMVLAGALCVIFVAGCTHPADRSPLPLPQSAFVNWPDELNNFRFRWTAETGIDLLTGPPVLLRAYLESYRVGFMMKTVDATYPGFRRAVPETPSADRDELNWNALPVQLQRIRPAFKSTVNFGPGPFFGNEYFHILEITRVGVGYRAYVCDALYKLFHPSESVAGKYSSVFDHLISDTSKANGDFHTLDLWRIEFELDPGNPPSSASAPVGAQQGPNPAPLGDVFGDWRVTGASPDNYWGPSFSHLESTAKDPDYLARRQQCLDRQPYDAEQRKAFYTGVRDSPPQADPAVPGWPDNPS